MDIQFFKKISIPEKFGLFGKAKENILGIDIGASSVKIVQLKKEKERAILETYGALATGPYANLSVGQAAYLTETKAVEMLKDLLKESGAKSKDVAVSVNLRNTFVTTMEIPSIIKGNLADIIAIEARKYIPLPASEIIIDWWAVPQISESFKENADSEKKTGEMEILLVAIYKDAIESYKKLLSKAGLNIQLFEIEIFSAVRACIGRETSPVLLLDLGASGTKMAIVDYGIVRSVRSFDRGSQDLTLALSNSLGVDFGAAEKTKQEIGFSSRPEHKEIAGILESIIQYIFSEANLFMADYRKKRNRSVSKVILTGGGASLKGIADIGIKNFGVEVILAAPFSKVEYPVFMQPVFKEAGPVFSTALGLALRGLQ